MHWVVPGGGPQPPQVWYFQYWSCIFQIDSIQPPIFPSAFLPHPDSLSSQQNASSGCLLRPSSSHAMSCQTSLLNISRLPCILSSLTFGLPSLPSWAIAIASYMVFPEQPVQGTVYSISCHADQRQINLGANNTSSKGPNFVFVILCPFS